MFQLSPAFGFPPANGGHPPSPNLQVQQDGTLLGAADITDVNFSNGLKVTRAGTVATVTPYISEEQIVLTNYPYSCVGSGIETTKIQAAINAAYGKTLYVPAGVFTATTLTISDSIRVTGPGTLKQADNTVGNFITLSGTSKKFFFDSVTLDGNEAFQAAENTQHTVRCTAIGSSITPTRFDFKGVTFLHGNFSDISVFNDSTRATYEELRVQGCDFLSGREGINTADDPVCISIASPINYVVVGNTFDLMKSPTNLGRAGVVSFDGHGAVSDDKARGVVNSNMFNNIGRKDVSSTLGCIDLYSAGRSTSVVGNVIVNAFGRGIQAKADVEQLVVSGNVLDGLVSAGNALIVVNSSVNTHARGKVTVSGNTVRSSDYDGILVTGFATSSSEHTSTVSVTGNTVETCARHGICVNSVKDASVCGNTVRDCGYDGILGQAIVESMTVNGNTVTDSDVEGIRIDSGSSTAKVTICGNTVNTSGVNGIRIDSAAGGTVNSNTVSGSTSVDLVVQNVSGAMSVQTNTLMSASPISIGGTKTFVCAINNIFSTDPAGSIRRLVIASDTISVNFDYHSIETEALAATDNVATINGGSDGMIVTFSADSSARDVVFTETGNIRLNSDFTLTNTNDTITLRKMFGVWQELCRSDNAA